VAAPRLLPGLTASLLLEGELVVTCADCGTPSTASLAGTDGWTLRRVSALRLVDICPDCSPRQRAASKGGPRRADRLHTQQRPRTVV